jgi:cysteinyl-tRNA synthetase
MINTRLKEGKISKSVFDTAYGFLSDVNDVMGIFDISDKSGFDVSHIEALIDERNAARKNKDFARSDSIRDSLTEMGIILEDTPQGTKWKHK